MEIRKYHVFWEALIISIFIFALGIAIGFILENNRSQQISFEMLKSENNLIDARNLLDYAIASKADCDILVEKNIEFGNKIYEDAGKIDEYESANQLTNEIVTEQHRKYDILRTIFWQNSIKIKEECPRKLDTLVYLYDYDSDDISEQSKQEIFSNFLIEVKHEFGENLVLIPIAKNLGIASLDLLISDYNLESTAIIYNENKVFTEPTELLELRSKLESSKNLIKLN